MACTIDKEALTEFINLLDKTPQDLISFERAVELMTQVGFSCRLACQMENWSQEVTFYAPPLALAPVEAAISTPLGSQHITLEPDLWLGGPFRHALECSAPQLDETLCES